VSLHTVAASRRAIRNKADYLEHVGQNPGHNGWPVDHQPSAPPPTRSEIGHQFADEMRGVSMWETYRGPLIFVGIVVVVAMLIAAF
jgi:hypothetical protein